MHVTAAVDQFFTSFFTFYSCLQQLLLLHLSVTVLYCLTNVFQTTDVETVSETCYLVQCIILQTN